MPNHDDCADAFLDLRNEVSKCMQQFAPKFPSAGKLSHPNEGPSYSESVSGQLWRLLLLAISAAYVEA